MRKKLSAMKLLARGKSRLQLAVPTFFAVMLALASVSTLAYIYLRTSDAALRSAWQMMKVTNNNIRKDVLRYMGIAKRSTTAVAWSLKGTGGLRDNREKIYSHITGQLRAQRELFSMSVADNTGSVLMVGKIFDEPKYSVQKSKPLPPEIKYRVHWVDLPARTEYYHYLNSEMEVVDQETVPASEIKYDARTKVWYREAHKAKANAWTDVILYSNGEFGASNVEPVLDGQGNARFVVSATIALSLRDGISSRLNVAQHGIAFIVDGAGQLIAYPDRAKITRCEPPKDGAPAKCQFNSVTEIGNDPLATAFEKYLKKSDLSNPENIPAKLNYNDYLASVNRLDPDDREAFAKVYDLNEKEKTILLRPDLSKAVQETVPDILDSIGYTYNMRFTSGNTEYLASFHNFPEHYGKSWMIGVLVPIDDFIGALRKVILQVTVISVLIAVGFLITTVTLAHRILAPLKVIAHDMRRIQKLDIDDSVVHASFFYEITLIADALTAMKHGLKAFSRFVPYTLVKQLIESGKGADLGGEKRVLTMMFTDIAGFTTLSENTSTELLLEHVSEYLDVLTRIILDGRGTVDKYMGDAIMCFWGAPVDNAEHEYDTCRTALMCTAKLKELNDKWTQQGKAPLFTRFGINSGEVSVGNMGSSDRMNYTVLGDAVNLAARLENINKVYGTDIIVGESTYQAVKSRFCFRPLDIVSVRGKTRKTAIYHLLAGSVTDPALAPTAHHLAQQSLTERAFHAYVNRDFQSSLDLYSELAAAYPGDQVAAVFVERCRKYLASPPAEDWDGVTRLE